MQNLMTEYRYLSHLLSSDTPNSLSLSLSLSIDLHHPIICFTWWTCMQQFPYSYTINFTDYVKIIQHVQYEITDLEIKHFINSMAFVKFHKVPGM